MDPDFPELTAPHLVPQSEINDLVRDFNLPKILAELLTSRLQRWNFLQRGVKGVIQETPAIVVITFL